MTSPLHNRVAEMFGVDYPIFGFAHHEDVIAEVCFAGGVGVYGGTRKTPSEIRDLLKSIRARIGGRPFGIDLVIAGERAIAAAAIAKWPTAELIAALETVGVPCARVNFLEQVLLGEQARANGFVHEFDHPRLGPMILPAPPVAFSGASYAPANTTPAYGEHTGDVLMRLGYTSEEIADLSERGVVGTAAADIG